MPGGLGGGGALPALIPGDLGTSLGADVSAQRALIASRRVGRLLLKAEEAEAEKVAALARELIEREFV